MLHIVVPFSSCGEGSISLVQLLTFCNWEENRSLSSCKRLILERYLPSCGRCTLLTIKLQYISMLKRVGDFCIHNFTLNPDENTDNFTSN